MNNDLAKRYAIIAIRYLPIVMCCFMTLHVGLLLTGNRLMSAELMNTFVGYSTVSTIQLLLSSYALKFCRLHRLFILYNEIVSDCIGLQQKGLFTPILTEMRLIVFLVGLILIIFLIKKLYYDN